MSLNIDQKRLLAATLTEIEEHLLRFERWLEGDETVTVFRKVDDSLSPEQKKRLLEAIGTAKEHLRAMRDFFNLSVEVVYLPWHLSVVTLHLMNDLLDCEPERLKAFGEIDGDTAEALKRFLRLLTQDLTAIRDLAHSVPTPKER